MNSAIEPSEPLADDISPSTVNHLTDLVYRDTESFKAEARTLLMNLSTCRVAFVPFHGLDLAPVCRLSHMLDVVVAADVRLTDGFVTDLLTDEQALAAMSLRMAVLSWGGERVDLEPPSCEPARSPVLSPSMGCTARGLHHAVFRSNRRSNRMGVYACKSASFLATGRLAR
jgi:hypothetical protein